jgi:hypothetical protein
MRQQLDVTLVQLRAYVAADSFNVTAIQKNPGDPPDEVGGVDLQPVFKNFGATPAKDVSTWNCGKVLSNEEAKQFGFRHDDCQYPNDPSNVDRTVGPGGQVLGSKFMVRGDDMTKVARGQQIYLWGEITYSETFPHTPVHHYRYCRRALVASATYVPIYAYEPRCNFAD